MNHIWFTYLLCSFASLSVADMKKETLPEQLETCLDHKGKVVLHGDRFFPLGSDPCTQCTCLNGKPEMCISVFCSPPENCRQFHALSDKCCEFVCLDRDFPNKGSGNGTYPDPDSLSTTNLGLRLVASTVTSFLILALLLFMIHRLRQRRLLLMIRRFHARRMDAGNSHLSRRFSEDDDGSVGYFVGHDHLDFSRYDEPPPPYTLWKPPEMYIPPGEAPPPYDLSVQLTAPFSSNGRYNFASLGQTELTQQRAAQADNRVTATQVVVETPPTIVTVNQNSTEQHSDHLPSVSSMSILSDAEVETIASSGDRIALPPDLQYEESHSYRSNNLSNISSCYSRPESDAIVADVSEEDLANGNALPNTAATVSIIEEANGSACTCNAVSRNGKSWSKRHSCGEFTEQSRPKSASGRIRRDKRFSLGPVTSHQNNNLYPDPTVWNGEISESSSSSTPTYDQPTPSPSTSDSSFAEAEFSQHPRAESVNKCGVTVPLTTSSVISRDVNGCVVQNRDADEDTNKAPPFHKKLSNLKKFSLIRRKKKKRQEERPGEISCSLVCQNVSDTVLTTQPIGHLVASDATSIGRGSESSGSRPIEAINPHIGHKLASSGMKGGVRPTNINIPGQPYRQILNQSSNHSTYYGLSHADDGSEPTTSTIVAIHHNATSTGKLHNVSSRTQRSPDFVREDFKRDTYSTRSPTSFRGNGISRSGSICSETGERRYYKSPSCLSSPSSSHPNEASEPHSLPGPSSESQCISSIRVPGGSQTSDVPRASRNNRAIDSEDSFVKSIPIWIVNSMGVLPRQDNEPVNAGIASSTLNRCLSTGQIGEHSGDPTLGSSVAMALEIRDPSLCDSSWEACSHL